MARIPAVRRQDAGPVTRLTYSISKRKTGGEKVPEPVEVFAHHPLLLQSYGVFELGFERARKAPKRLKYLVEVKTAALAGCEWCLDFGSWVARSDGTLTERQLRELPDFRESDAFDADEKLVLEYAEGISRTPVDVPDELFDRLRARFDEAQIVELTFAAGIENLRARVNWALGIGSQDYSEGAFCALPERSPRRSPPRRRRRSRFRPGRQVTSPSSCVYGGIEAIPSRGWRQVWSAGLSIRGRGRISLASSRQTRSPAWNACWSALARPRSTPMGSRCTRGTWAPR